MTRKDQIKILDDKIKSNVNQYDVDRLNAEISAFSSGDLSKYEFLTRKDKNYKPNALDKAKFELSPLGKAFSMGLDKTAEGYQKEGVIKLLKDIRDGLAGRNGRNDGDDDNYKLHLKKLLKHLKYDKEFLKKFKENINNENEDKLEAEELNKRFKRLINKKRFESLKEYLKETNGSNPQSRVDALRKKLNNNETSDDYDNDDYDNDDYRSYLDKLYNDLKNEEVKLEGELEELKELRERFKKLNNLPKIKNDKVKMRMIKLVTL